MRMHRRLGLIGVIALFTAFGAVAQNKYTGEGGVQLDVPYVPSPQELVDRMLTIATAGPNDIHYDLGSGDGRIVITAARDFKIKKGTGVDLDPVRIAEANENAKKAGVTDRVTFIRGDLFAMDFKDATILTMYLLPEVNLKLRPKILSELKPGTRIVSHAFTMGDWQPDKHEVVDGRNIYFWIVPAQINGTWQWQVGNETQSVSFTQMYQTATGSLSAGASSAVLQNVVIAGDKVTFEASIPGGATPRIVRFSGQVKGDVMDATVDVAGKPAKVTAKKV